MTNEQKASQICDIVVTVDKDEICREEVEDALLDMAKWKDKQFAEEKQALIDKACEWLNSQACCGYIEDVKVDEFIEEFKKAMRNKYGNH